MGWWRLYFNQRQLQYKEINPFNTEWTLPSTVLGWLKSFVGVKGTWKLKADFRIPWTCYSISVCLVDLSSKTTMTNEPWMTDLTFKIQHQYPQYWYIWQINACTTYMHIKNEHFTKIHNWKYASLMYKNIFRNTFKPINH